MSHVVAIFTHSGYPMVSFTFSHGSVNFLHSLFLNHLLLVHAHPEVPSRCYSSECYLRHKWRLEVGGRWLGRMASWNTTVFVMVFLPGESQGQRSLLGCRLCGRTESDTTDVT